MLHEAGLAWPNLQCPVILVECDDGLEQKAAISGKPSQSKGGSFFNEVEARLAIRCLPWLHAYSQALSGRCDAEVQDLGAGISSPALLTASLWTLGQHANVGFSHSVCLRGQD